MQCDLCGARTAAIKKATKSSSSSRTFQPYTAHAVMGRISPLIQPVTSTAFVRTVER